ncbi:MAG TPA: hypothetical protein VER12_20615 [Polyangiaceae bacterium]|nr:hypothetical protein [Polyangiaceae bacterium]
MADSAEVQLALEAAYEAGCATRPTQFPYDASAGASGESGESGESAGGSTGGHAGTAAGR